MIPGKNEFDTPALCEKLFKRRKHEMSERKVRVDRERRQKLRSGSNVSVEEVVVAGLLGSRKTLVEKFTIKTTEGGNSPTTIFFANKTSKMTCVTSLSF